MLESGNRQPISTFFPVLLPLVMLLGVQLIMGAGLSLAKGGRLRRSPLSQHQGGYLATLHAAGTLSVAHFATAGVGILG